MRHEESSTFYFEVFPYAVQHRSIFLGAAGSRGDIPLPSAGVPQEVAKGLRVASTQHFLRAPDLPTGPDERIEQLIEAMALVQIEGGEVVRVSLLD